METFTLVILIIGTLAALVGIPAALITVAIGWPQLKRIWTERKSK